MAQQSTGLKEIIPQLGARHCVSGLNSRFNGGQASFSDYIALNRGMIAKAHPGANAAELKKIVDGNAPFELRPTGTYQPGHGKPYQRGILLTHGLTDSPYFMRYLADFFQENGFRVMAVLLPGHGTQPGDLLDVTWQEWAKAVAYGTEKIAAEADEVYLGGLSAGAALSIYHSLQDRRVRGLFLFSPALQISPRAARAGWHKIYSWLVPKAKWIKILPDIDIYKYESFPKNAAAQMHALIQAVHARLQNHMVNIPVFAAASYDDKTVDVSATIHFVARTHHSSSKLVLYITDIRNLPLNIRAKKLELVISALPDKKILSSAHTAMLLPPEDEHYGAGGDYFNCSHYYPHDMEKYALCKNERTAAWLGEITEENLQAGVLRRLMVNPNFPALMHSLKRFIDNMPQPRRKA